MRDNIEIDDLFENSHKERIKVNEDLRKETKMDNPQENEQLKINIEEWNFNVIKFNDCCKNNDMNGICISLDQLMNVLTNNVEKIEYFPSECLTILEESSFFNNIKILLMSSRYEICSNVLLLITKLSYLSSLFCEVIMNNGLISKLLTEFLNDLNNFPKNVIVNFFRFIGIFSMDLPDYRYLLIQYDIINICGNILKNCSEFEVICAMIDFLYSFFKYHEYGDLFTFSKISNIYSIILFIFKRFPNFDANDVIPYANKCVCVLNFCCCNENEAKLSYENKIPIFLFEMIRSNSYNDKDLYTNIFDHLHLIFLQLSNEELNPLINSLDFKIMISYLEPNNLHSFSFVSLIVERTFCCYSSIIPFVFEETDLLLIIKELFNDSNFSIKSSLINIIIATIINSPNTEIIEKLINDELVEALIDLYNTSLEADLIREVLKIIMNTLPETNEMKYIIQQII